MNADSQASNAFDTEAFPSTFAIPVRIEPPLDRILQVCLDHLSEPKFSTVSWADAIGISDRHLRRRVFAVAGTSPLDWMREQRLLKAKRLFDNGTFPNLGDAGKAAGFAKLNYFYRLFRARFRAIKTA